MSRPSAAISSSARSSSSAAHSSSKNSSCVSIAVLFSCTRCMQRADRGIGGVDAEAQHRVVAGAGGELGERLQLVTAAAKAGASSSATRPACASAKACARSAASSSRRSAPASSSPWTSGERSQETSSTVMPCKTISTHDAGTCADRLLPALARARGQRTFAMRRGAGNRTRARPRGVRPRHPDARAPLRGATRQTGSSKRIPASASHFFAFGRVRLRF